MSPKTSGYCEIFSAMVFTLVTGGTVFPQDGICSDPALLLTVVDGKAASKRVQVSE
jgi:hypothetical protein